MKQSDLMKQRTHLKNFFREQLDTKLRAQIDKPVYNNQLRVFNHLNDTILSHFGKLLLRQFTQLLQEELKNEQTV